MILIIDNYDSFTQNLVQYIGDLGFIMKVIRNDDIALQDIYRLQPTHIFLSPGPGNPNNVGTTLDIIKNFSDQIPILGICLGHQSIGYAYGAKIIQLDSPMHGKVSKIFHKNIDLFSSLPNPFLAVRYHSLIIDSNYLPNDLEVTAWTEDGIIMGIYHKKYPLLRGVQFHPESLWTNQGKLIIQHFLFS